MKKYLILFVMALVLMFMVSCNIVALLLEGKPDGSNTSESNADGYLMPSVANGLYLHYSFDAANAQDSTGTNHGILSNQSYFAFTAGHQGNALVFNNTADINDTNGYIDCGPQFKQLVNLTGEFSLAFWINPASTGKRVLGNNNNDDLSGGWFMDYLPNGTIRLGMDTSNGYMIITNQTAVSTGNWSFVAYTFSESLDRAVLFVNGVAVTNTISNAKLDFVNTNVASTVLDLQCVNLTLGAYWGSGVSFFSGMMDEVRFFTRVLNSDEITNLYQL